VATVTTCVDCGVPLGSDAPEEPAVPEIGAGEELVAVRHAEVTWIEGLAHALADAGLPSRVELPTEADARRVQSGGLGAIRCTLYVRRGDAEVAARIDAAFARTQVPDLPDDDAPAWAEAEACPGCGSSLDADAEECPECGLTFGSEG